MFVMNSCPARRGIAAISLLLAAATAHAGAWRESSIHVDGVKRWYRVYVPDALPRNAPLLLSLHGGTGSMYTIDKGPTHGWVQLADRHRFLLLVPNGTNDDTGNARGTRQNWNDVRIAGESQASADDVGFLRALLERIETEYATDRHRLYVTGNSNGGLMTYRLMMEMPERIAAAAAFIANLPVESRIVRSPAPPVPLLIWSGTEDRLMKYAGGEIPGLRGLMRSTPENVAWWVNANRADAGNADVAVLSDADPGDGCRVEKTDYPPMAGGAPVVHYLARGGGHTMPSRTATTSEGGPFYRRLVGRVCHDVDGPDVAWEFMSGHTRSP